MRDFAFILLAALSLSLTSCGEPQPLNTAENETVSPFLSYPYVTAMAEDATGHIWIGTTYGLNRALPYGYHQYYAGQDSLSLQNNHIMTLHADRKGRLWVAGKDGSLCYMDRKGVFRQVPVEYHEKVRVCFLELPGGRLYCNDESSIFYYDEDSGQMRSFLDCPQNNLGFFQFGDNLVLVYPDCIRFHSSTDGRLLAEHRLKSVCHGAAMASDGGLWLSSGDGTRLTILNLGTMEEMPVPDNLTDALVGKRIHQLVHEENGEDAMFINVSDDILHYDPASGEVHTLREQGFSLNMQMYDISCMFYDSADNIWVGTDGGGLQMLQNFHKWNRLQVLLDYFKRTPVSRVEYSDNTVYVTDYQGDCFLYSLRDKEVRPLSARGREPQESLIPSRSLTLSDGSILSVNDNSNITISVSDRDLGYIIPKEKILAALNSRQFHPTALFQDSRGKVWIGTKDDGLAVLDLKTTAIRSVHGIMRKDISSIFEDKEQHIWAATKNGLYIYDIEGTLINTFFRGGHEGENAYMDGSYCMLPDGIILLGTLRGLVIMNPEKEIHGQSAPFYLEDLRVHNSLVRPGKGSPIDKAMIYSPQVRLRHDQNSFGFSFAELNYWKPYEGSYSYMLEGFDKYWISSESGHDAFYSNVPPGRYTFRARLSNSGEDASASSASCEVIIRPAPWASWWARTLYLLVATVLLTGFVHLWLMYKRKQETARRIESEKEQERHMNDIIKKYFANVAHQLRTPLTMIYGPIETLYAGNSLGSSEKALVRILRNNTRRMLGLVNQIMNLHSLESDALALKVSRCDIVPILEKTLELYRVSAKEKNIRFYTEGLDSNVIVYADSEKIVNILDNLLSNAFKFTPEGGRVEVAFLTDGGMAGLNVKNNGPFIPEDKLEDIFRRFYQVDGASDGKIKWGSGVGLYYARRLAVLHHGTLKCRNTEDGVCFSLRFPIAKEAFSENEISEAQELVPAEKPASELAHAPENQLEDASGMLKPSVLLVDDDLDISIYLKTILGPRFKIRSCYDAESALRMLEDYSPDLIISDIMMNGMSGLDLCSRIKNNLQFCHIPLILLTAKDRMEDQIAGLKTGADAYVTKPFNAEYLLSLADNLLEGRKRLQKQLSEGAGITVEKGLSAQDKAFLEELYGIWDEELSNTEFNIASVVSRLHISHTKFIYKVKGLTGFTPSELFKNHKLNKAAAMLREGKYNVSEVADLTGFGTLAHFSRVFKKKFGVPPSEY